MKDDYTPIEIKAPPLALLFPVISLASFVSVFYTPALPSIKKYFQISLSYVESSMYFYLLFIAIGCLVYGPISNRFGRKPALCIGISKAILGSLLCIVAGRCHSFLLFDIGRILQALGAAAGLQVGFTIIGDCYRPPKSIKVASYVSLAFAVGPSIGITIGGLFTTYFGWMGCFYFISIYLISLLVWVIYSLPETLLIKHIDSLKIGKIFHNYGVKFTKKTVFLTGLLVGCVIAFSYLFYAVAPFIGISILNLSPRSYGLYSLIPSFFIVIGCLLTAFLTKYLQPNKMIIMGLCILVFISILFVIMFLMGLINTATLFFPFSVASIGIGLVQINAIGLVMHHSLNKSLTSSVVMFINMLICTIVVFALNTNQGVTPLVLPVAFLILGVIASAVYYKLRKAYTVVKH